MKLNLDRFLASVKTKREASSVFNGIWISRSAVGVGAGHEVKPIFGFGSAFCQERSDVSSVYELLERLVFLPSLHDRISLNNPVAFISDDKKARVGKKVVHQYLMGSMGPKGVFYANGCAISTDIQCAIDHSKRELLERHLCCEIWYRRARSVFPYSKFKIDTFSPYIKIALYTTDVVPEGELIIASLDSAEDGFFALGAAVRTNIQDACEHAVCEVVMLFEDAKKKRTVGNSTDQSRSNMLSLREAHASRRRRAYFESLITHDSLKTSYNPPLCETIVFEPLPTIYAARSFSVDLLDPREFDDRDDIPLLPLF